MIEDVYGDFNGISGALADDRSQLAAQAENATREGNAYISHISTGIGQQRVSTPIEFPLVFRDIPHMTSGSAVIKNSDTKSWYDPIGTAGVYAWTQDSRGHYIGCQIWIRVEVLPIDPSMGADPPDISVQHFLTFTGRAVKDLSRFKGAKSLAKVKPRTIGI